MLSVVYSSWHANCIFKIPTGFLSLDGDSLSRIQSGNRTAKAFTMALHFCLKITDALKSGLWKMSDF